MMKKFFILFGLVLSLLLSNCAQAIETKFVSTNSDKLIIFLTGWGCDDSQFANMIDKNKDYDILLAWDYSNLNFSPAINYKKYKEIYLVTYSAGVYVAGLISDKLPPVTKSIAINGNPYMFDPHFGIKKETLDVFRSLNPSNALKFRNDYLVKSKKEYAYFNNHSDKRNFESYNQELDSLEAYSKSKFTPYSFDVAILSDSDKIFNPKTQKEYFKGKYIVLKNTAHNPFYYFPTFNSILELTDKK